MKDDGNTGDQHDCVLYCGYEDEKDETDDCKYPRCSCSQWDMGNRLDKRQERLTTYEVNQTGTLFPNFN